MPHRIPRVFAIFPLEAVMLVPGALLPLHIFEPRYLAMVDDTIDGHRMLAMAMPVPDAGRPHAGGTGAGRPPAVHPVCGLGRIVRHAPHDDGSADIVLEGIERMQIEQELPPEKPYRRVLARALPDVASAAKNVRERMEMLVAEVGRLDDGEREQLLALPPGRALDALLLRLPIPMLQKHGVHVVPQVELRLAMLERIVAVLNRRLDPLEFRPDDPRLN